MQWRWFALASLLVGMGLALSFTADEASAQDFPEWSQVQIEATGGGDTSDISVVDESTIRTCWTGSTTNYVKFAKSDDAGDTWSAVSTVVASGERRYCSIDFLNEDAGIISHYENENSDVHVFNTTDGGATWTGRVVEPSGSFLGFHTFTDAKMLDEDSWVVAVCDDQNNLTFARTDDSGFSWAKVEVFHECRDSVVRVFQDSNRPDELHMGMYQAATAARTFGHFKSIDGGSTWSIVGIRDNFGLDFDIFAGDFVYKYGSLQIAAHFGSSGIGYTRSGTGNWSTPVEITISGTAFTTPPVRLAQLDNGAIVAIRMSRPGSVSETMDLAISFDNGNTFTVDSNGTVNREARTACPTIRFQCGSLGSFGNRLYAVWATATPTPNERWFSGSEVVEFPEGAFSQEVPEFAEGLLNFIRNLGFRTQESLLLFALILIGLTIVVAGSSLRWMTSGRAKNLTILGVAAVIGAITVLLLLLDLWMFTVSLVLASFAIGGSTFLRNTLRDTRQFFAESLQPTATVTEDGVDAEGRAFGVSEVAEPKAPSEAVEGVQVEGGGE